MKALSNTEIEDRLKELDGWEIEDDALHTIFEFEDFKEAFSAMVRIAFEAEKMNHHPEWTNIYNTVEIYLSTHEAEGITQKDFDLAKLIDKLVS